MALSRLVPLAAVLTLACSASSPGGGSDAGTTPDAAGPTDVPTAMDAPGATQDAGTDASPGDVPYLQDAPATVVDGGYTVPAGFTLTPFLSDAPVHTFPMADMVLRTGRDYAAVLETDVGAMVIDLTEQQTPITVNSFVFLALHHFFDGIAFHRVITGFVAQGGDPNTLGTTRGTWGTGGPGYQFGLETDPTLTFDGPGVVGMARATDPNTNGSQFYITLAATHSLDGMYTVFGRVVQGLSVLPALAVGEPPTTPTRMTRVYIIERSR